MKVPKILNKTLIQMHIFTDPEFREVFAVKNL